MIEKTIHFGEGDGLVGTVCLPAQPSPFLAQVLFNAGIVHRVGPHRLNVRLARALARRGIASIRFDLSGLGDSERSRSSRPFEEQAVADLRAAMDALGREAGARRFSLLGFCSGGRHGFDCAPVDERVAGLLLHDTYAYPTLRSWLGRLRLRVRRYGLASYAGTAIARRLGRLRDRLTGAAPRAHEADALPDSAPTREAFAARALALHARGVKLGVMFSGEGDNYNYAGQFRDAFRGTALADCVSCDYLPEMDHTVMVRAMQDEFVRRLEAWTADLEARCRARASA